MRPDWFGKQFLRQAKSAFFTDEALEALGCPAGLIHDQRGTSGDSAIPAAYTFFAQFVDHVITLDVSSQLNSTTVQDASLVKNLRTMTLDLDCVYAFGPEASPFLYENGIRLVVGNPKNANELRRVIETDASGNVTVVGRALIGDLRNDENIVVSQLQCSVHKFQKENDHKVGRKKGSEEKKQTHKGTQGIVPGERRTPTLRETRFA